MIVKAVVNTTLFGESIPKGSLVEIDDQDENELKAAQGMIKDGLFKKANEDEVAQLDEISNIANMNVEQLKAVAEQLEIDGFSKMKKAELIAAIEVSSSGSGAE